MFRRSTLVSKLHWSLNSTNGWGFDQGGRNHNMSRTQRDLRLDQEGEKWLMNHQQLYKKTNTEVALGDVREVEVPAWQAGTKPTHFLSMRVPIDSLLQKHMTALNASTKEDLRQFLPFLVPSAKLHVTLSVFGLHGEERALANEIGDLLQETFEDRTKPIALRFHGLGRFGQGRVVFARVQSDYDSYLLDQKVGLLRAGLHSMKSDGVSLKGNAHDSFTPHVTVCKVSSKSKTVLAQNGKSMGTVPRELYDPFANEDFGVVPFESIDLCSMKGESTDGYYRVLHRHYLK